MTDEDDLDATQEALVAEAKRMRASLGADSLIVICTLQDSEGNTYRVHGEDGNYFASRAAMRELIVSHEEKTRVHVRKDHE